jgi:hypothetical protein
MFLSVVLCVLLIVGFLQLFRENRTFEHKNRRTDVTADPPIIGFKGKKKGRLSPTR